jgi:hypothetical protein
MDDQPTCGKGLAEHSALPAKLATLIGALAENLELHLGALDQRDPRSRAEHDAYVELAKEHRAIASQLAASAQRMAGYRDLPMGAHDARALADPRLVDAFERFVAAEEEVMAYLEGALVGERAMLDGARGQRGG